jgi:16S rRNA (guanine527-N7)-methyltransferase
VTPRDVRDRLDRKLRRLGTPAGAELRDALQRYLALLARWNEKINLTSLDDPDEAIDRLIVEPLIAARHLPLHARSAIDIGSGGGSPAIPLKLARPELRLWMVEPKARKAAFLREAVRQLGLEDTVVETSRYEGLLARADMHEAMDVLTIRAVRVETRVLLGLQAFVKPDGLLFLFRGPSALEALTALPLPLEWAATYPLVASLRSQLLVLRKRST